MPQFARLEVAKRSDHSAAPPLLHPLRAPISATRRNRQGGAAARPRARQHSESTWILVTSKPGNVAPILTEGPPRRARLRWRSRTNQARAAAGVRQQAAAGAKHVLDHEGDELQQHELTSTNFQCSSQRLQLPELEIAAPEPLWDPRSTGTCAARATGTPTPDGSPQEMDGGRAEAPRAREYGPARRAHHLERHSARYGSTLVVGEIEQYAFSAHSRVSHLSTVVTEKENVTVCLHHAILKSR